MRQDRETKPLQGASGKPGERHDRAAFLNFDRGPSGTLAEPENDYLICASPRTREQRLPVVKRCARVWHGSWAMLYFESTLVRDAIMGLKTPDFDANFPGRYINP